MESAICCGMELARSAVWNHHEVMYGINPKENARWRVMPYAYGDSILTCGEITYQSFGLDKKRTKHPLRSFFGSGTRVFAFGEDTNACRLRASSTRSARGLRTLSLQSKELGSNPQFHCPKERKKTIE